MPACPTVSRFALPIMLLLLASCDTSPLAELPASAAPAWGEAALAEPLGPAAAPATRLTFTDKGAFLAALETFGYARLTEGFEDDAVWGDVRTSVVGGTMSAPSITTNGLTWAPNNPNSEVTTSNGAAWRGQWGVFQTPHGDFLNGVGDGIVVTHETGVVAAGGWVETNTPYAGVIVILDGDVGNPVDFDGLVISSLPKFIGVIDTDGFNTFEVRETEWGGDELKYLFFDEFVFGIGTGGTLVTAPLSFLRVVQGTLLSGDLPALSAADDTYLEVQATDTGTAFQAVLMLAAESPVLVPAQLDLTLELATDTAGAMAMVQIYNVSARRWDRFGSFTLATTDTEQVFAAIPAPANYVNPATGQIRLRIMSRNVSAGYTLRLDRVTVSVD